MEIKRLEKNKNKPMILEDKDYIIVKLLQEIIKMIRGNMK